MKFLAPRCHIMKPFQFKNKINTTVGMEWNHMFSGRDCVFNSVVATVDTNYGSANLIKWSETDECLRVKKLLKNFRDCYIIMFILTSKLDKMILTWLQNQTINTFLKQLTKALSDFMNSIKQVKRKKVFAWPIKFLFP